MIKILPFVFFIIITGCGGGDGGDTPSFDNNSSTERTVSVKMTDSSIKNHIEKTYVNNDGVSVQKFKSISKFNHNKSLCNYEILINDDDGERTFATDLCLDTDTVVDIIVRGEATLTVISSLGLEDKGVSDTYTLTGTGILGIDDDSIVIELNNDNWTYVTVDWHDKIQKIELFSMVTEEHIEMNLHDESSDKPYFSGYVYTDARVRVHISEETVFEYQVDHEKDKHIQLYLNIVNNGGSTFNINDTWSEPEEVELSQRLVKDIYIDSNNLMSFNYENSSLTDFDFVATLLATDVSIFYLNVAGNITIKDIDFNKVKVKDKIRFYIKTHYDDNYYVFVDNNNNISYHKECKKDNELCPTVLPSTSHYYITSIYVYSSSVNVHISQLDILPR